jgi:Zn-dependent M28 family amino/carboxypeptidase
VTARALVVGLAALVVVITARAASPPVTAGAAEPSPKFDGAAALRHLERLVAFGPRPSGSAALERSRGYIVAELKRLGVRSELRLFDADTPDGPVKMVNVVGVLPGPRSDVIMIAGHYDTKLFREFRFVGANDGGSSAALLLELARALAARPRRFTYWLVWFDGEEARVSWTERDSLYGSRRLATELLRDKRLPRAMVLVDMIGDRDLGIRRDNYSASWLTDIVWSSAARLGHGRHFLPDPLPVEDDHVPFLRLGVPATLLIDFDYPPWHTADDTLDKVSAASLGVVGDVLLDALPSIELYLSR